MCNNPSWAQYGFALTRAWEFTDDLESYRGAAYAPVNELAFDGKLPDDAALLSSDTRKYDAARYAAALLVHFMEQQTERRSGSTAKAHEFVASVVGGKADLDAAIERAMGLDRASFEELWAEWVRITA